jgi:hypothetical protein
MTQSFLAQIRLIIDDALFRLDLDPPIFESRDAAGVDSTTCEYLEQKLLGLIEDVKQSELSPADKDELLTSLDAALAVLRDDLPPQQQREGLERVLGKAVAKAGRGGAAATLWKRVAEAIVVAEAAVSLGLGIAAISHHDPAEVEVTCNVIVPALPSATEKAPVPPTPPALPAPSPADRLDSTVGATEAPASSTTAQGGPTSGTIDQSTSVASPDGGPAIADRPAEDGAEGAARRPGA